MKLAALVLLGVMCAAQTQPPNIPCHIGDTFIVDGQRWDCSVQAPADVMLPKLRWARHLDSDPIVGVAIITNTPAPTPEPEDVPAIQVKYKTGTASCKFEEKAVVTCVDDYAQRVGCAEKSRILMHDENDPPKYYCHRVKP